MSAREEEEKRSSWVPMSLELVKAPNWSQTDLKLLSSTDLPTSASCVLELQLPGLHFFGGGGGVTGN